VSFFEKPLRSTIEDTVSQTIEDAIMELNPLLKSIPKEISIDKIATLNVTCINDLVYGNDSINFEIDGLFSARDKAVASKYNVRNSQASVSCERAAKMLGISIHEKVVNSASLVYFDVSPCFSHNYAVKYLTCSKKFLISFLWSGRCHALDN